MRKTIAFSAFLASSVIASAQTQNFKVANDKIIKSVVEKMASLHVPGASLVIVKDGKVVLIKGFGKRDVSRDLPVTPDTLFAIGSSTKAFTAALVSMAADEGKLSLSDSPTKYLPYFHMEDPEADKSIKISDLMSHRSGLMRTDLIWYPQTLTSEEIISSIAQMKPTAKIGQRFQYQNVMFNAAGRIAGVAEGKTWEDLLKTRILEPLHMDGSNVSVPVAEAAKDHSLGYVDVPTKSGWINVPMRSITSVAPAGAINSNAKDMAKWVQFMLDGGVANGKRLISEKAFADLTAKHMAMSPTINYGYGWMVHDWNGHQVAEHGGNIDGFSAMVAFMPDQHLGFAMLTNLSATPFGSIAMEDIWGAYVPVKKTPLAASTNAVPDHPEQEVGDYTLEPAKVNFPIQFKDHKLTVHPDGQPEMEMKSVGGRRYVILPPAPPNVFISFRATKDDPKRSEMVIEQSGQTIVLQKPKPYVSPMSVEDLMAKMVAAQGFENLRKHETLTVRFSSVFENQGLTSTGVIYKTGDDKFSEFEVVKAAGKTLFWTHSASDRATGGAETSLSSTFPSEGPALKDLLVLHSFSADLNWKSDYKQVEIVKDGKVGSEEVFVVKKTLPSGATYSESISKKTFLVLQAESPEGSSLLQDYRSVDGVMLPFKVVRNDVNLGSVIWTAYEVSFDKPVPEDSFKFNMARIPTLIPYSK